MTKRNETNAKQVDPTADDSKDFTKMKGVEAFVEVLMAHLPPHRPFPIGSHRAIMAAELLLDQLKRAEDQEKVSASTRPTNTERENEVQQRRRKPSETSMSSHVAVSRTFRGEYRTNWKVGAWVELKHDRYWLPGKISRVALNDISDTYDVLLSNGDEVLDVSTDLLRTKAKPLWFKCVVTVVGGALALVAFLCFIFLLAELLDRFSMHLRATR